MSRYEWERGSFVIPSTQWAAFKKSLRDAYNKALANDLTLLDKALAKVKAEYKGKRNVDWHKAVQDELNAYEKVGYGMFGGTRYRYDFQLFDHYDAADNLLVRQEVETTKGKVVKYVLRSVKKKDFPDANGKTMSFDADDGSIHLNDKTRTVEWAVSENNHACDRARESLMGRTLFALLAKVQWGRNSGGHVIGNDEYNEDSAREYAGGGGSYIKETFGPLGEQEYERTHGLSRRATGRSSTRAARK